MTSYTTVSLVKESQERLARFAEYYLARGAERVVLYYDGEIAADPSVLMEGVDLIACDDAFWAQNLGMRPAAVEERQRAIYGLAYPSCTSDWVLIVDADEFVFGRRSIKAFLADIPAQINSVRLESAEAVYAEGDDIDVDFGATLFRLSQGKYIAPLLSIVLHRRLAGCFIRGLLGHGIGKQFLRTGLSDIRIDIHHTTKGDEYLTVPASHLGDQRDMYLGHFDAVGFERWCEKWDRRLAQRDVLEMGRKREKQLAAYVKAAREGPHVLRRLFRRFYGLDRWQFELLSLFGLAFRQDLALSTDNKQIAVRNEHRQHDEAPQDDYLQETD